MTAFADLSRRSQLRRLRVAAERLLRRHGIGDAQLRLLNHDYNTTYRVDCDAGRFALRINVNSPHGAEAVAAEAAWVAAVNTDTDLVVPRPIPTADGELSMTTTIDGLEGEPGAVLYSWLPGRDLGEGASRIRLRSLGAAMATLHNHTDAWSDPVVSARPDLRAVLLDEPDLITIDTRWIPPRARPTLEQALDQIGATLRSHFEQPGQLIHADLHGWNVKWHDGRLAVFDFDDCGIGTPLQDLAIACYYLRDDPGAEDALMEGYASVRPLPIGADDEFEALVASRNLMLLNAVLSFVTADMSDFLPGYIETTLGRMAGYLDTGRIQT